MTLQGIPHGRRLTGAVAALALAFFLAMGFWEMTERQAPPLPTDPFRAQRSKWLRDLGHWTRLVDALEEANDRRRREIMSVAVEYLNERVRPQTRWEELHLYPAADQVDDSRRSPVTVTLRFEHEVIELFIAELEERAAAPPAEWPSFLKLATRLAAFLRLHWAEEEESLFELLDRKMTPEEVRRLPLPEPPGLE